MKIQFGIQYTNKRGDSVESSGCVDKSHRQFFHDLLDEYLDNNRNWKNSSDCEFVVGGYCEIHNHHKEMGL